MTLPVFVPSNVRGRSGLFLSGYLLTQKGIQLPLHQVFPWQQELAP
jgi:hypothetical protein